MNESPYSPKTHMRGLYDDLNAWLDSPIETFAVWLTTHALEDSSRDVKQFMWKNWCSWLATKGIRLDRVTVHQIAEFFEEKKIAKGHRYRYVRLIEVAYIHLMILGLSMQNPGTKAAWEQLTKGENDPMTFLSDEEKKDVERVIGEWLIEGAGSIPGKEKEEKKRKGRKKQDWVRVRDAAICAAMMGGGATVWALSRLTVSCTNCTEGYLLLPRKGGADYEATLLPFAQTAIDAWLRRRRDLGAGVGDWMFPADVKARHNPETLTNTGGMSASSIFRAVRGLLRDAGVTGNRACGQTLRNTYAGTLIDLGFQVDQLATNMGFHEENSALRLRSQYLNANAVARPE